MKKYFWVAVIIMLTVLANLIAWATQGVFWDIIVSTNATLAAEPGIAEFPTAQPALVAMGWLPYILPSAAGLIAIVWTLKKG